MAGVVLLELAGQRENTEQQRARVVLEDPTIIKTEWIVSNHPEIPEGGLAVRPLPKSQSAGENNIKQLPAGYLIKGVLWKGQGGQAEKGILSWVAFKYRTDPNDTKDLVGFVPLDCLTPKA
ncbi:MAG: hypothetical protein G01um10145_359 [Microgenomates group bacterium Gr01-1014_5]|nr:MAG: hypothetical protein G01um10145_359 [Microgenomates group bacterium Gr01-1014_5]